MNATRCQQNQNLPLNPCFYAQTASWKCACLGSSLINRAMIFSPSSARNAVVSKQDQPFSARAASVGHFGRRCGVREKLAHALRAAVAVFAVLSAVRWLLFSPLDAAGMSG